MSTFVSSERSKCKAYKFIVKGEGRGPKWHSLLCWCQAAACKEPQGTQVHKAVFFFVFFYQQDPQSGPDFRDSGNPKRDTNACIASYVSTPLCSPGNEEKKEDDRWAATSEWMLILFQLMKKSVLITSLKQSFVLVWSILSIWFCRWFSCRGCWQGHNSSPTSSLNATFFTCLRGKHESTLVLQSMNHRNTFWFMNVLGYLICF